MNRVTMLAPGATSFNSGDVHVTIYPVSDPEVWKVYVRPGDFEQEYRVLRYIEESKTDGAPVAVLPLRKLA